MSDQVQVVISNRWDDVQQVLRVVYESYLEVGYTDEAPSGMRFIAPYLNPGAVFAYALMGGRPAASATVIPDGPFGLPSDRAYAEEIDALRAAGEQPVEFSSLAVAPWARGSTRRLYPHLVAVGVRLMSAMGDTHSVISVEPRNMRFYGTLFGVRLLGPERPLYGAPAILMGERMEQVREHLAGGAGPLTRRTAELAFEDDPVWVDDRRARRADWPAADLGQLVAEQGTLERTIAQLLVLGDHHPDLLDGLGACSPRRPS